MVDSMIVLICICLTHTSRMEYEGKREKNYALRFPTLKNTNPASALFSNHSLSKYVLLLCPFIIKQTYDLSKKKKATLDHLFDRKRATNMYRIRNTSECDTQLTKNIFLIVQANFTLCS